MKNGILPLLLLASLKVSWATQYSQLIDAFSRVQNPCDDIRNGQFICQDCGTLAFCLQQDGEWTTLTVTECQTEHNLYCDEEARGCIFKHKCKEPNRGPKFECQNGGIFPDPYDCKYYHVCDNSNEGERFICPSGTAYSPASKTCSLTPETDICLKPQYECNELGQMGAWPTDPSIYYVCHSTNVDENVVRYPALYRCRSGYVFVNTKCIPYTSSTEAPPTAPTTVPEIMTCIRGSGIIPNPYDCYSYFVCVNGLLVSTTCPTGTHYNDDSKSCIFGKCNIYSYETFTRKSRFYL
ncbi:peritrophin-48-like [Lucilia sericata]|uniref:peritrophin-48-like n=1 Tax=Lucilia sericata TaxID=13632 RepID=UPI0018A863F3|nr:peritrophin-48-like [Lucilia sericata]